MSPTTSAATGAAAGAILLVSCTGLAGAVPDQAGLNEGRPRNVIVGTYAHFGGSGAKQCLAVYRYDHRSYYTFISYSSGRKPFNESSVLHRNNSWNPPGTWTSRDGGTGLVFNGNSVDVILGFGEVDPIRTYRISKNTWLRRHCSNHAP